MPFYLPLSQEEINYLEKDEFQIMCLIRKKEKNIVITRDD